MNVRSILKGVAGWFGGERKTTSRTNVRRASLAVEGLEERAAPASVNPYQLLAFALATQAMSRPSTPKYSPYQTNTPSNPMLKLEQMGMSYVNNVAQSTLANYYKPDLYSVSLNSNGWSQTDLVNFNNLLGNMTRV